MTQSNDAKNSNLGDSSDRNLSHTQVLLKEAEAVLQRLAKNRAAMTRPHAPVPTVIERAPEPAPRQTIVADPPLRKRKSHELTVDECEAFTRLFARRGYVVNADVRSITGLTMAQASLRLQVLSSADVVRREGMGSLTRYYPGTQWRPSSRELGPETPPDPKEIQVSVGTPAEALSLAEFAEQQVEQLACDASGEQPSGDIAAKKALYLKQLRSHRGIVLLARDGAGTLVGYARCGFDRKRRKGGVGFIWTLACAAEAHENARIRLLESASKWLIQQGATAVRVQVPHVSSAAQQLFAGHSFRPTAVEMELVPGAA